MLTKCFSEKLKTLLKVLEYKYFRVVDDIFSNP